MAQYRVKVRHDGGVAYLTVGASDEAAAIATIMRVEGCPRRAIEQVAWMGTDGRQVYIAADGNEVDA